MAIGIGAIIAASVISSLVGAGASMVGSALNYKSIKDTNLLNKDMQESANQTNLEVANANNQTQLDLAKNGYQYKMQDLQAAGLNPVLAAQGLAQPTATLSTPNVQAAKAQAPMIDMNGVASALTAMNNTLLTAYLMDRKEGIAQGYQANSKAIADERNSVNQQISENRNSVLRDLYKRKGISLNNASDVGRSINSAKQISEATNNEEWDSIMKELKKMRYKYNWRR